MSTRIAKIAIATDLHLMAPELLEQEGPAFDKALLSDRKLLVESPVIISALFDEVIAARPDLFLITGDLSKDGERPSHELMRDMLRRVSGAGIRVLVIPGNHDINNPLAAYYRGEERRPAPMVSPEEFAEIYKDYGYSLESADILERGPRLSYLAEPIEGLWIIAIDSNIYEHNIRDHYPQTIGSLSKEDHDWIREVGRRAKAEGKLLLGMIHHGVLEHFQLQGVIAGEYLLKNWLRDSEKLADAGLRVIFSGHFHAQDVMMRRFRSGYLYDVETGSPVTYPCPYRIVKVYDDRLEVRTNYIRLPGESLPRGGGLDLQDYAYEHLKAGLPGMVAFVMEYFRRHHPDKVTPEQAQLIVNAYPAFEDLVLAIYTGHIIGDEKGLEYNPDPEDALIHPKPGDKLAQLRQFMQGIYPQYDRIFAVIENCLYDTSVPDNDLTIPLL